MDLRGAGQLKDPGVHIREARAEDAAAVGQALTWLFEPPGAPPPDWDLGAAIAALERAIDSERATVLVAELDGVLTGLCTAYRDIESARYGARAWVEDLAVDPHRRSLGIGKSLLGAAMGWARAHGATHLELDSGDARADAHRFYEREQPSWRSVCFGWRL